jgi:hypothetical protein
VTAVNERTRGVRVHDPADTPPDVVARRVMIRPPRRRRDSARIQAVRLRIPTVPEEVHQAYVAGHLRRCWCGLNRLHEGVVA